MSTAAMQTVNEQLAEARDEAFTEFHALVYRIADDETPGDVREILADADKTEADLNNAVRNLRRRRQMADELSKAETLIAETPEVQQQIAGADAELEVAKRRHQQIVGSLSVKLRSCLDAHQTAADKKRDLEKSVWDERVSKRLNGISSRRLFLAAVQKNLNDNARVDQRTIDKLGNSVIHTSRVEAAKERLATAQAELQTISLEYDKLAVEERELLTQQYIP